MTPARSACLPVGRPKAQALKSPKYKSEEDTKVIMGELRRSPSPPSLNPQLEAALERWKRAAEGQGGIKGAPWRDSDRAPS